MKAFGLNILVPAQIAAAMPALAALSLWPPASGEMLLVPLATRDASAVAKMALAGGALLLGPGPLPGSLVVVGERSAIARRNSAWNIVIMAAPPAGCGRRTSIGGTA